MAGAFNGSLIAAAIGAPILGAVLCTYLLPKKSANALVVTSSLQALAALSLAYQVYSLGDVAIEYTWMRSLGAYLSFRADNLSCGFAVLISMLSLLVAIYAKAYMSGPESKSSFFAWQSLFSGAMMGVLFAGDMILFYLFWEIMIIPSTALIVYWGQGKNPERVGIKYFMVTHVGALLMFAGILWIIALTGTSEMAAAMRGLVDVNPGIVRSIGMLLAAGFMVKMAVVPGHVWLPDAHSEAQLPTSIMLSAVMMNMGIYGLLRYLYVIVPKSALLSISLPLMILGVINQWYGGIQALRQSEMKRMAAYSTISQMGYILFGIGTVSFLGIRGAMMQAFGHGIGKALLFMSIGGVIHATGAHKIDEVSGLGAKMPLTMLAALVAGLTLSGAPPFALFQSEWQIFAAGVSLKGVAFTFISISAGVITALYCLRFVMRVFYGPYSAPEGAQTHESPNPMLAAMLTLAVISLILGIFPAISSKWAGAAASLLFK